MILIENDNRNFSGSCTITLASGKSIPIDDSQLWDNGFVINDSTSSTGGFDIGRIQRRNHRAAHDLNNQPEGADKKDRDRQDPVPDSSGARGRNPSKVDREQNDGDDGDPEIRCAGTDQGKEGRDPVEYTAHPKRCHGRQTRRASL